MICPVSDKKAYPSEDAARRAIKGLRQNRRDGLGFLHPYRCGAHWHVGHGHHNLPPKPGRKFRT